MAETVEFINVYTDIVVENFLAVVKQNLLFQAQLKMSQAATAQLDQLKQAAKTHDDSLGEVVRLRNENQTMIQELQQVKTQLSSYLGAQPDQHRIQTALNDHMRENASLRDQIAALSNPQTSPILRALQEKHITLQTETIEKDYRITQLESLVAPSKLKKISPSAATSLITPLSINIDGLDISSGGQF